jgi:hypothetical protein
VSDHRGACLQILALAVIGCGLVAPATTPFAPFLATDDLGVVALGVGALVVAATLSTALAIAARRD